jgi:NitT/TauT family transport system substrate-binding protein
MLDEGRAGMAKFKLPVTLALGLVLMLGSAVGAEDRDVKFVLDFISLGRHAPWYVALGKGYFKDEGLNVSIMPSKGTRERFFKDPEFGGLFDLL